MPKVSFTIKILFINLTVFLFLLILGEIALRLIKPETNLYKRSYPDQFDNKKFSNNLLPVFWPKNDEKLGWVSKSFRLLKFSNSYYNKFQISYYINNDGFRDPHNFTELQTKNSKRFIPILGDSFVFGVYVKEEQTIPNRLNSHFENHTFLNAGIPGWGIDQMYLCYKKYFSDLNSNLVILFYIDDDIPRVLEAFRKSAGMNKPYFGYINDSLKVIKESNVSFTEQIFQNSYFLNPFYIRYNKMEVLNLVQRIFINLRKLVNHISDKLLLIRCPMKEQLSSRNLNDKYSLSEFFNDNNFMYFDLYNEFKSFDNEKIEKLYLKKDGHLSSYGTRIVSKLIINYMLTNDLLN